MSKFTKGVLIGIGVGLAAFVAIGVYLLRDPIAPLKEKDLSAARDRWSQHGPVNYDLDITMTGDQAGAYAVQVRAGKVTALARDGHDLKQRGNEWRFWTVPGLFEIMAMDLAEQAKNETDGSNVRIRLAADFGTDDGRPIRYRRYAAGEKTSQIEWRIDDFVAR